MSRIFALGQLTATLASAGTVQRISTSEITCTTFEVFAPKTNTGTNMYVGTASGAVRPIVRGNSWSPPVNLTTGTVDFYDLQDIYFDGDTTSDTIIVTYTRVIEA